MENSVNKPYQNLNLNDAELADVDGDEDMDIEEEEQNCPFCKKNYSEQGRASVHISLSSVTST